MNINLTFFVQIINFLISYFIITKFFLKPVLSLIKQDILFNKALLQDIAQQDQILLEKQVAKKARWNNLQSYFFKNKPDLSKDVDFLNIKVSQVQKAEVLSKDKLNDIVSKLSNDLKLKVFHD